jgi:hypothetical protein
MRSQMQDGGAAEAAPVPKKKTHKKHTDQP